MRLTNVLLQSPTLEDPIRFSLNPGDQDARYKVRNIVGIDAEDIVAKFYGRGLNASEDVRFYNFTMKPRDIVIRVALNPKVHINETHSHIREDLYRSISATRSGKVKVLFMAAATTVAEIDGFITKFEASHFTQTPEVQITIKCNDPMFRGVNPVILTDEELSSTNPVFVPDSLSTSPHGCHICLEFTDASPTLTIQDEPSDPNWVFVVTPDGGFLAGDVLHLSSDYSNKFLYIERSSTIIQLMDKISPISFWPVIFPGQNTFYFLEIDDFDWQEIIYYPSYWGV